MSPILETVSEFATEPGCPQPRHRSDHPVQLSLSWARRRRNAPPRKPDRSGYAVSALTIGLGSHQSHRRLCLVRSPRSRRQWPHAAAHQTATVNLCPHNAQGPNCRRSRPCPGRHRPTARVLDERPAASRALPIYEPSTRSRMKASASRPRPIWTMRSKRLPSGPGLMPMGQSRQRAPA